MEPESPVPRRSWRRGWAYTLGKCAAVTATLAGAGAYGLSRLLHAIHVPWFIPRAVVAWLLETLGPWAVWVGGFLGALVGLVVSVGVIVWDARRGRLSRLP